MIRPLETMAAGGLAVTAFAASAVTLLHDLEATAPRRSSPPGPAAATSK